MTSNDRFDVYPFTRRYIRWLLLRTYNYVMRESHGQKFITMKCIATHTPLSFRFKHFSALMINFRKFFKAKILAVTLESQSSF